MIPASSRGLARLMLLALVLSSGLLGLFVSAAPAYAVLSGCRGDPVITFSDGTKLFAEVEIETTAEDVQEVVYTVHVPAGVTIDQIKYKGDFPERVELLDDSLPGVYGVETVAYTSGPAVVVTASNKIKSLRASATGLSGESLAVSLIP